jgi:hypothetical protein
MNRNPKFEVKHKMNRNPQFQTLNHFKKRIETLNQLKTIYETHLWEGKFEVKRKIVWVLGVVAFSALSGFLAFRRFGVVWVLDVLGIPALSGSSAFRGSRCSLSSTLSSLNSQKRKRNKKRKGAPRKREEKRERKKNY